MRILIAEDGSLARTLLKSMLSKWGHEVVTTKDGEEAWEQLQEEDAPRLVLLDWMMPKMHGIEVCKNLRELSDAEGFPVYIIMLTSKESSEDIVAGLNAGADDYIIKSFSAHELKVRLNVGIRYLALQNSLLKRAFDLEQAVEQVKQLQNFLPICAYCKKIRDDENNWSDVEQYIKENSEIDLGLILFVFIR